MKKELMQKCLEAAKDLQEKEFPGYHGDGFIGHIAVALFQDECDGSGLEPGYADEADNTEQVKWLVAAQEAVKNQIPVFISYGVGVIYATIAGMWCTKDGIYRLKIKLLSGPQKGCWETIDFTNITDIVPDKFPESEEPPDNTCTECYGMGKVPNPDWVTSDTIYAKLQTEIDDMKKGVRAVLYAPCPDDIVKALRELEKIVLPPAKSDADTKANEEEAPAKEEDAKPGWSFLCGSCGIELHEVESIMWKTLKCPKCDVSIVVAGVEPDMAIPDPPSVKHSGEIKLKPRSPEDKAEYMQIEFAKLQTKIAELENAPPDMSKQAEMIKRRSFIHPQTILDAKEE